MAENTQIAVKSPIANELITQMQAEQSALPAGFNITRHALNCAAMLNSNDTLKKYAKEYGTAQIKLGMVKGAYLGLDFMSKEAYLVPFGKDLNFMPSYKGDVKLCKKYAVRPIKDIFSKVVREGDFLEESITDGKPSINFKPKPFNDGEIIGAFAVCLYEDGGLDYDVMSKKDIENTRSHSRAANSAPWKSFYGEMCRKTVLHRLCKHIDLSFDAPEQYDAFQSGMEIETDVKTQVENEIEINANTKDFEFEIDENTTVEKIAPMPENVGDDDLPFAKV